jgi:hypothetical protein
MRAAGLVLLGAALCVALVLAPTAEAHKLTAKRAEAVLNPIAEQMAPQVAPRVAAKLPGATISRTGSECTARGHEAICSLDFLIAGASTGEETACSIPAFVRFRGRKSRKLRVRTVPELLTCIFLVR